MEHETMEHEAKGTSDVKDARGDADAAGEGKHDRRQITAEKEAETAAKEMGKEVEEDVEVREGGFVVREGDESDSDAKEVEEMKTPNMSTHYEEEQVLEKMGITPEIRRRSTALRKMGLTEEHFTKGEELMAQAPPASALNDKVEKITGYSHSQIRRSKAMAVLGTTEEMIDEQRSKLLGALGLEMQDAAVPRRQRSCADLLGVPIRRHTVSAHMLRRRSGPGQETELDEVLAYPRLLALYQKECQANNELRKEIANLRCLLDLRNAAASFHDEDDLEDYGTKASIDL